MSWTRAGKIFTRALRGFVPEPGGSGTTRCLREDAAWATPEAFPVGAVFIAVVATNPGTLLGYGTWTAFGTGRVLVAIDPGDTDFDVVEETGGTKTVASTGTVAAITATPTADVTPGSNGPNTNAASPVHTHDAPAYTGSASSVVQPYIVTYMWQRTV